MTVKPLEMCTRREDEAFGRMIAWFKVNGLEGHTPMDRKTGKLIICKRRVRYSRLTGERR